MLKSWLTPLLFAALGLSATHVAGRDQWDDRVDEIMQTLSTDDIIGQMSQISLYGLVDGDFNLDEDKVREYAKLKVGSYLSSPWMNEIYQNETTRYSWNSTEFRNVVQRIQEITMEENGGHPMVFGLDSVHGAVLISDTVKFGHQINGAASFNPSLVTEMGRVAARDTLAAGIPWSFAPILEISSNPAWARTFETFGEDPYTVSVMADAVIRGFQNTTNSSACMKHFIAYSKTITGHDKDGVTITDYDLLNYFARPFKAAVEAGVISAMENYISVNGVPTIQNTKLMSTLLRDDLGFDGMIVTDYAEIDQLTDFHRTARSSDEATRFSLERTSIDMSMIADSTSFINGSHLLLERNPGILGRMTESARRVIKMKVKLGLYDNPMPGEENLALIANDDDIAAALEMARESIVLVQNNDSTLPLATSASVFLTGHSADDVGNQCGGWTITWQGVSGKSNFPHGITVKEAMEDIVGSSSFSYFNGLYANGSYSDADLATAKEYAAKAEYTIAVIGEAPSAEKPGDINDLALAQGQIDYVNALAATGTKVILVLFEGRPRLLGNLPENVYAVINGMLPCEQGGKAMAEIIYGKVNPSGRMPITYPKDQANTQIPYNHRVTTLCEYDASPVECEMQWIFGHGLSYTTFDYSDMTISKTNVTSSADSIDVSVTVTNSGSMAGKETVMLFLTQPYRSFNVPEVKLLKKFNKISLDAGASQTVTFTLTADDWSVYYPQIGHGFLQVAEDADYVISIKPETDCDVYNSTAVANPLCATFALQTGEYPYGSLMGTM